MHHPDVLHDEAENCFISALILGSRFHKKSEAKAKPVKIRPQHCTSDARCYTRVSRDLQFEANARATRGMPGLLLPDEAQLLDQLPEM